MKLDDSKPTLRARFRTAALLLDQEAGELENYEPERDREKLLSILQAGWREVVRIKVRAKVIGILENNSRRQAG